jgi:hypothetical protein
MPQAVPLTLTDDEVAACQLAADERAASGLVGVIVPTVAELVDELAHAALRGVVTHYRAVKGDSVLTKISALKASDLTAVASTLQLSEDDLLASKG